MARPIRSAGPLRLGWPLRVEETAPLESGRLGDGLHAVGWSQIRTAADYAAETLAPITAERLRERIGERIHIGAPRPFTARLDAVDEIDDGIVRLEISATEVGARRAS